MVWCHYYGYCVKSSCFKNGLFLSNFILDSKEELGEAQIMKINDVSHHPKSSATLYQQQLELSVGMQVNKLICKFTSEPWEAQAVTTQSLLKYQVTEQVKSISKPADQVKGWALPPFLIDFFFFFFP